MGETRRRRKPPKGMIPLTPEDFRAIRGDRTIEQMFADLQAGDPALVAFFKKLVIHRDDLQRVFPLPEDVQAAMAATFAEFKVKVEPHIMSDNPLDKFALMERYILTAPEGSAGAELRRLRERDRKVKNVS